MEITEMKDAVTERAAGYAETLVDTLRDIAKSLSGSAEDLVEDASDSLPGRGVSYSRAGLWFGLGVALVGGAIYAWRTYGDRITGSNEPSRREPSRERKPDSRPQSRTAAGSVRSNARSAGHSNHSGKGGASKKTQPRASH